MSPPQRCEVPGLHGTRRKPDQDNRPTASTWDPLASSFISGPCSGGPHSDSNCTICLLPPFLPPSNYHIQQIRHISVAARFGEQTGKLIIIMVSGQSDAIRIQRGKQQQTNHIYPPERLSIFPPPQPRAGWAQAGDESALTWGPGFASPARPAPPQSAPIELRRGIWEPLKRCPESVRAKWEGKRRDVSSVQQAHKPMR